MGRAAGNGSVKIAVFGRSLSFLLWILASIGCSDSHVIVAFGDSTTTWRGPTTNWVLLLREELDFGGQGVEILDSGVSSDTTKLARDRFWWDVMRHRPDLTVIQFGINDAMVRVDKDPRVDEPRIALEEYEANLRYFVDRLRCLGSRVVLMTPNPLAWSDYTRENFGVLPYELEDPRGMNVLLDDYSQVVRRIALEEEILLLDVQRLLEGARGDGGPQIEALLRDGVHPNDRAYRMIADALRPVLVSALVGAAPRD